MFELKLRDGETGCLYDLVTRKLLFVAKGEKKKRTRRKATRHRQACKKANIVVKFFRPEEYKELYPAEYAKLTNTAQTG